MIAFDDWALQLSHFVQAGFGVGIVTYDIAKTNVSIAALLFCIREHGLKCLEVSVNIAEDRKPHFPLNMRPNFRAV